MKKLLVAVALALSVTACASGQSGGKSEWTRAYGKTFYEPNAGMAAVYIIRDDPSQDTAPLSLTMGQQPVSSLSGLTWTRLDLVPSFYDFRAFGTEGSTELIVTVNAGQSRFFLIQPKPQGNADLQEISQAEGRRLVRKGQVVWNSLAVGNSL
ncbi:MAG: hypothetical protein PSV46_04760 [Reyranella sp.]|nr:hypothetical protein [Reyranella sp.]